MPWTEIGYAALVCLIATLIVCAELLLTFGASFFRALQNKWTWLLILINIVFAGITYLIARLLLNVESGLIVAGVVGALYPVILRSRFTFFRQVGAKDDPQLSAISLKMDELYTKLQARCYREVDSAMAIARRAKALILTAGKTEVQLIKVLKQVIAARQVAAEQQRDEAYLNELLQSAAGEERRYRLAIFLVDIAGNEVNKLFDGNSTPP
jgi:hypothetical protein